MLGRDLPISGERFINTPTMICLFYYRKYGDRSWEYINRSYTHECGNWGWGRTIPWKGIHTWVFHGSVGHSHMGPDREKSLGSDPPNSKTTKKALFFTYFISSVYINWNQYLVYMSKKRKHVMYLTLFEKNLCDIFSSDICRLFFYCRQYFANCH